MPDTNPLTFMYDFIDSLVEAKLFTAIYVNLGNWKIPMVSEDQDKTYLKITWLRKGTRMSFGFLNELFTLWCAL